MESAARTEREHREPAPWHLALPAARDDDGSDADHTAGGHKQRDVEPEEVLAVLQQVARWPQPEAAVVAPRERQRPVVVVAQGGADQLVLLAILLAWIAA